MPQSTHAAVDKRTRKELLAVIEEFKSERDAAKRSAMRAFDERNNALAELAQLRESQIKPDAFAWLQVRAQHSWHGELLIEGNRFALLALATALNEAAHTGSAILRTVFASDGEGYEVQIVRKEDVESFTAPIYLCEYASAAEMAQMRESIATDSPTFTWMRDGIAAAMKHLKRNRK